ncbi:polyprenyl synthetase family protein [Roseburia sp. NSJ-9]|uniref:Polyprenyl synthetase family protein n=1 Tax=Roseburia lenta TaxID=2763061 RepID=A0ABR7GIF6_9FIRM|nr:farnesyl diphosphate synthase [Roseburia lenta]MBC5687064.1 polyprenyl synthetase family protein [Roseburia lenta]MDY3873049.1 farnesyl diphosphate synthase [Roseburia lenta]
MDINKEIAYKASDADRMIYRVLPAEKGYQKTVFQAMNYSVLAGGKRIRPILMLETYKLFGGSNKAIESFVAAIELIHTYSLVHDDLPAMDDDELRRGKLTTHAKFGEAMGVLAGDGLLNYAFEIALDTLDETKGADNRAVIRSLKVLAKKAGIYGMIGGQVVDVEAEKQYGISKNRLDFIYELKTGALIEAAMMIGAILGGATDEEVEQIEEVAKKIGLAFQIQDDVLDVIGETETIGKSVGSDEKNQKATYVVFEGLEKAKQEVADLTDDAIAILQELPYENPFLTELLRWMVLRDK